MKQLYLFCILSIISCQWGVSQTYTATGGPANPGGSCFCMTVANETATGVWEDNNLTLSDFQNASSDLTWDAEIYLGDNDAGGHGMAFVLQTEGPVAGGNGGAPLGYGGASAIVPSIAVEIDTNPNGFDAVADDHLAVHLNGDHKVMASGSSAIALPNMEDDAYHQFVAVWHYDNTTPANSSLTVTIDGTHSISYQMDPASLFSGGIPIYAGFTAGTNGLATNTQKVSFGLPGGSHSCSTVTFPVEFLSFEATSMENQLVGLVWETASEVNNDYFEILRSKDDVDWTVVAVVDGQGTSSELHRYQWTDEVPYNGMVFYQIRQVDYNGEFSFSEKLEIEVGDQMDLSLSFYPNPASDLVFLRIQEASMNHDYQAELYHPSGALIRRWGISVLEAHADHVQLDISGLARGTYLLKLGNQHSSINKKLMIR
ncbi:MAG: T9SS type A sorting domain-containing protein [Bacteroidota bacterium]